MLKLSNFLKVDNFVIFKEKCLSFGSPKVWNFIAVTEETILDKNLTIEQQVRNILGYIVSDLSILDFLITNVFEYDIDQINSLKYFMEESVDSEDKQLIFEELVKDGIECITTSQYENDDKVFENILSTLVEEDEEHIIKDNVVYFVQGNFLICYSQTLCGFNFEYFDKEYGKISELLNLEQFPVVDQEYTDLLFMNFTFEDDNWLEDIYGLTEAHYNELGEDFEHSNLYGDVNKTLVYFENSDNYTFETIFNRFGYLIKAGYNLLNTVFFNENLQESEEKAFNTNYPFNVSYDDLLMEMNYKFNQIYLNYIQKFDKKEIYAFDKIVDELNNFNETDSITLSKENLITELENFNNITNLIGFKDIQVICEKYFTFIDDIEKEQFDVNRFVELLKMWNTKENKDLTVWIDSYLTLD